VLIIDGSLLARLGLKHLLEHDYRGLVVGEARDADGALAQAGKMSWDLAVLDINISGQDGFDLLTEIRRRYPSIRVLVMSSHTEPRYAVRAQRMAADGYTGKNVSRADLLRTIRNVMSGKAHFEGLRPQRGAPARQRSNSLSRREYRVMLALAKGRRAVDIAAELELSIKTVSTYKRRILDKLKIESLPDLVRHVIQHQLS
jgi:DNA-binding NarL/FixJ family response regulator